MTTSTFRLIGAEHQHNFHFKVNRLDTQRVSVSVEAEGIPGAHHEVQLSPNGRAHLVFRVDAATTYLAEGDVVWDSTESVVHFQGHLQLANVVEVLFQNCPVAIVPKHVVQPTFF